jgi:hypothetical protein
MIIDYRTTAGVAARFLSAVSGGFANERSELQ